MSEIFGIPTQALFGQLLIGLINGSFYALLSLGLAVIFGLLNIINFAHGAQYMMGAFCAWFLLNKLGISYWWALVLGPVMVGATGLVFVSQRSVEEGGVTGLGLKKRLSVVHRCRGIGKRQMKLNDALPKIEVDPESYEVRADGELLTCAPAERVPLSRRYSLF